MEIRYITPADDKMTISRIYEESWKYAYKGIIPQDYLESLPEGRWVANLENSNGGTLVCVDNGRIVGTSSFCESRFNQFKGWGEIISIYLLPDKFTVFHKARLIPLVITLFKVFYQLTWVCGTLKTKRQSLDFDTIFYFTFSAMFRLPHITI